MEMIKLSRSQVGQHKWQTGKTISSYFIRVLLGLTRFYCLLSFSAGLFALCTRVDEMMHKNILAQEHDASFKGLSPLLQLHFLGLSHFY